MSTAIARNFQIGIDPTPTNNFTLYQPATPDGTLRLGNGNTGITSSLLTLTSAGNLGIGTSSPGSYYAKNLVLGVADQGGITIASTPAAVETYLMFADGTSGTDAYTGYIGYSHTNNFMRFATNGGGERMRIDSSGNVGIGTNSPTARLTVSTNTNNEGEIRISDNATYYAGLRRVNATDEFRIGSYGPSQNITFYTVSSERARITSSGDFRITWNQGSFAGFYFDSTYYQGFTNGANTRELFIDNRSNDTRADIVFRTGANTAVVERARIDFNGNFQFNSGYGSVATAFGCRAWVNFNGTGTVAIRASGNVSSITDNGVSDYTINFTTAMPDANYAMAGVCGETAGTEVWEVNTRAASSLRINTYATETGGNKDCAMVSVAIFR